MKTTINYLLRALCLLAYGAAILKLAGLLPGGSFDRAPIVAAVLLFLHAAELLMVYRHLGRYAGGLRMSIVLTMLFGVLHWKSLLPKPAAKLAGTEQPSAGDSRPQG
jgi:uncharacterized protein YhhL (DUF1145 family)